MTTKKNFPGGDEDQIRLLSFLSEQIGEKVHKVYPVGGNVTKVYTEKNKYMLKKFSTINEVLLQKDLTDALKRNGFMNTYSFVNRGNAVIQMKQGVFSLLEYIEHAGREFTYEEELDRKDGLGLLEQYHSKSERIAGDFSSRLPAFDLLRKWSERMNRFRNNRSLIGLFVERQLLRFYEEIGEWAINELGHYMAQLHAEAPVILHGDVAHHNFLRSKNGMLYLIDFDLISYGGRVNDYLQYANRILPFLHWDLHLLFGLSTFEKYIENRAFLVALCFPTDIYREWNRVIQYRLYNNPDKMRHMLQMTIEQFEERKAFATGLRQILS